MNKKVPLLKNLLLLGLLGVFVTTGCGKKGPPTPRDQVLQKQAQEQTSTTSEDNK